MWIPLLGTLFAALIGTISAVYDPTRKILGVFDKTTRAEQEKVGQAIVDNLFHPTPTGPTAEEKKKMNAGCLGSIMALLELFFFFFIGPSQILNASALHLGQTWINTVAIIIAALSLLYYCYNITSFMVSVTLPQSIKK